ncbi:VOC family protein [Bauldia sp.]|uniref:VOC family protein n=1 Tax=Bauldia sp. TaxID=2575872 RepID=UPI003BA90A78
MTAHGAFHWNELMTRDSAKAKDFYGKTLGWTFEDMPMPEMVYTVIRSGDETVGGMFEMSGPGFDGMPDHWMSYIAVDDIDKRVQALKDAGGTVMREPWDVEGVGRIALVADPGGAAQGWMTPSDNSGGN